MSTINDSSPDYLKGKNLTTSESIAARKTEYELAQKAASGDIEAFEKIYWKHHRRIFGICIQMTKSVIEGEDLTQQIFLNLFRKIGSFRGDSAFSTWLHRMSVNQILMHFRTNKSRKEETTEDGELPEAAFSQTKQPKDGNQILDHYQLSEAIAKLPDGYRKVVILHDIQGFEHEEIARMLGCATGTTKSQLHKARKKLRRMLLPDDALTQKMC